jgi:peptidoglycan/xylan/chitin deacetylase (PgdA/CDA1 family)
MMTEIAEKILGSARRLIRTPVNRLLNALDPPVVVLLYHRVATLPSDPEMLAVSPGNFHAHMLFLKENFPVVKFDEDWAKVSKPAVAVTFDDGYSDNALEALPILEDVGVPATFFVSTGAIGTGREFWWHELERIILDEKSLPSNFTLNDGRFRKSWPTGTKRERQELYQELVRLMTDADAERRNNWLALIRDWAGRENEFGKVDHRAMSVEELRSLAASRWATIGAHTVSHLRLSSLPREVQREEITASKRKLEEWLGREVSTFSYPYGRRRHYTEETVALCREARFTKAAANFPGQAHRWTDPHQIPRHLVRDWPVEVFAEKLRGFWTR